MSLSESTRERILALFFFALVSVVFFYKALTGHVILAGDGWAQNYPLKEYYAQLLRSGVMPLWNPFEGIGIPFIGELQAGALYPPNILMYLLLPAPVAFNAMLIAEFALAGFFMFIYLRESGIGVTGAVFGGMVFAHLGFMPVHKVHTSMLDAALWLPLMLYLMERMRKTLCMRRAAMLGVVVGVQLLAGHTQICVYSWMAMALYLFVHMPSMERRGRFAMLWVGAVIAGVLVALPQLFATIELDRISWRSGVTGDLGYLFFKEFHVYLSTVPSLIFPHLYTGSYGPALALTPTDAVVAFIGSVPLVLAVVAGVMACRADGNVRFWVITAALGYFLALGDDTPFGRLSFHIPIYNLFRSHSRNLLQWSFAMAALAAFGLDGIVRSGRFLREALWGMGALALVGAGLMAYYSAGAGVSIGGPVFLPEMAIMAVGAGALLIYRKPALARYAGAALIGIVLVEAYYFGSRIEAGAIPSDSVRGVCASEGYEGLRTAAEPLRMMKQPETHTNLYNVPCKVSVLNAYSAFIPEQFADMFDLDPHGYARYWDHLIINNTLLSMMNVRYIELPLSGAALIARLEARERKAQWQTVLMAPDVRTISARGMEDNNILPLQANVAAGSYMFSVEARGVEDGASLRVEAYTEQQRKKRFSLTPLEVYPGRLPDGEFREYHRMFHAAEDTVMNVALISVTNRPIEVRNIRLERVSDYGPLRMGTGGAAYRMVKMGQDHALIENLNALPRAYGVRRLRAVQDFAGLVRALDRNELNPALEAMVYESETAGLDMKAEFAQGRVEVMDYGPNHMAMKTDFDGPGFVVIGELYYPGWQAKIDGRKAGIHRVNGVMRGINVPGGRHEVRLEYRPVKLFALMVLSGLFALGLCVFAVIARPKKTISCR